MLRDVLALWADRRTDRVTRLHVVAYAAAWLVAAVVACVWWSRTVRPILSAKKPPVLLDREPGGVRFGLAEPLRREIFNEIAATEASDRANGVAGFPGQPWSQEDHRAAYERNKMRAIATRRNLHLAQVYLVLDEGIRERWPGADGKPLTPTTVPLDPRRR